MFTGEKQGYDRLTYIDDNGISKLRPGITNQEAIIKLSEVEDVLENGMVFPCKVGDTIYWVADFGSGEETAYRISEEIVKSISIEADGIKIYVSDGYFLASRFGECVFTDKAKAEAKRKELEESVKWRD